MKTILVIGATGLIGSAIVKNLSKDYHIMSASYNSDTFPVDITSVDSIEALFTKTGKVDGIVCTAGLARFAEWSEASDDDWQHGLQNKLMGQINLIRYGVKHLNKDGCIVLTTGVLAQYPIAGSSIVSAVNAGVESAIRSATLELKDKHVRILGVSPGWVKDTMTLMGMDPSSGTSVSDIALKYREQIVSGSNGSIVIV